MLSISSTVTSAKEGRLSPQNGSADSKQATNCRKHWPKKKQSSSFHVMESWRMTDYVGDTINI